MISSSLLSVGGTAATGAAGVSSPSGPPPPKKKMPTDGLEPSTAAGTTTLNSATAGAAAASAPASSVGTQSPPPPQKAPAATASAAGQSGAPAGGGASPPQLLDFIGSSHAVKDLFSLPYAPDRDISVAVYNLDGTLVIDADTDHRGEVENGSSGNGGDGRTRQQRQKQQKEVRLPLEQRPQALQREEDEEIVQRADSAEPNGRVAADGGGEQEDPGAVSTSLVSFSSLGIDSEALTIVNSVIEQQQQKQKIALTRRHAPIHLKQHQRPPAAESGGEENREGNNLLGLPLPEDYFSRFISPCPEPREYLSWRFHDLNLLVGSDALIYRSAPPPQQQQAAAAGSSQQQQQQQQQPLMAVRVEEARDMQTLLRQHENMVQRGLFLPDHQLPALQQQGKRSYADATRKSLPAPSAGREAGGEGTVEEGGGDCSTGDPGADVDIDTAVRASGSFSAPDLDDVRLQTCIVPANNSPLGGLLSTSNSGGALQPAEADSTQTEKRLSPVSTVLDVYLDNIIANVPQLALCLKEKGFIQSVKLLNTDEIPSGFMQPATFDTSTPFSVLTNNPQAEKIFSPQIMETNAVALLRFLKTNCTRDNATYLLRREAGQTNIQLYDVSTISSQRQRKWIWWLAMMSYRFAMRLRHLSFSVPDDSVLQRSCRSRQRSLLQNTLDLLDVLSDMEEKEHESLVAAVSENLADTFLGLDAAEDASRTDNNSSSSSSSSSTQRQSHQQSTSAVPEPSQPAPATSVSTQQQPYGSLSVDSLTKAQDYLSSGIKVLRPVLQRYLQDPEEVAAPTSKNTDAGPGPSQVKVVSVEAGGTSSDSEDGDIEEDSDDNASLQERIGPVVTQLFGMQHKFVNVSLRLAEIHLRNYYSSSAMSTLRASARGIAELLYLVQLVEREDKSSVRDWLCGVQLQLTWLWEHCGHFARSFAGDELWRDRGHASGDDIISVLQDAESTFANHKDLNIEDPLLRRRFVDPECSLLTEKSNNAINLHSLSGVVDLRYLVGKPKAGSSTTALGRDAVEAAEAILDKQQRLILRERRRVLVAACIAYCRAIESFQLVNCSDAGADVEGLPDTALLILLRQRLGDACNETGKMMLNELRAFLTSSVSTEGESSARIAEALLSSAQFWFMEGVTVFEKCRDLRNLALVRCNLCQAYKLRANAVFVRDGAAPVSPDVPTHAELCLQEAANHLQEAHKSLGLREVDPRTWDMVSEELAATFLVLGVRRRQSLIGSGNALIMQTLRLSPGKEHSISDPIERALTIYEQIENHHQKAACHYQLALFYSKIWTCQLNEVKTREKLAAAFKHYSASYAYFSQSLRGNEITFCILCVDMSSLYAVVAGEECTIKALTTCLDTVAAFSRDAIDAVLSNLQTRLEWFKKIETLATSIEERVFKYIRTLIKFEEEGSGSHFPAGTYKDLYRVGLQAKMAAGTPDVSSGDEDVDRSANKLLKVHSILKKLRDQFNEVATGKT